MTVFTIHILGLTSEPTGNPTRPVRFMLVCRMTNNESEIEFNGVCIECLNEVTRLCPGVEFTEICTGTELILTPTGEVNLYVEDIECPIFYLEVI